MEHLERLWSEIVEDPEVTVPESVYNDTIGAGQTHRIWVSSTDERLRSVTSSINSKLNDPKTREYGLICLSHFIEEIDPGRLVAIHEQLTSALHLSLKSLHLDIAHQFLARALPHCGKVPELNQILTSSIVPKILSFFCDSSRTVRQSAHELELLKICLQKYHGPCGNQRANLERTLLSLVETTVDPGELDIIARVFPLLSTAGGGGTNGIKHSEDWKLMVTRFILTIQDSLVSLYGDFCPILDFENTQTDKMNLPECTEKNVFQRISFYKNRLVKLAKLVEHYLSDPFPGPKPVGMKSIMNIIRKMMIVNPMSILKSYATPPREYIYLSIVIPAVHQSALLLLRSLISCVGSNILTEAADFEELLLQELKWMGERPEAFAELRIGVYKTILSYFEFSHNELSNMKTLIAWTKELRNDVQIKRKSIELNFSSKVKGQKKKKGLKVSGKVEFMATVISASSAQAVVIQSNPAVSVLALRILTLLIPTMDPTTHKIVSNLIGGIGLDVVESEVYPSPYDESECRQHLFECIYSIIQNPIHGSPISFSFFANLLRKGEFDPVCANACHRLRSCAERIAHPICPTLSFHTVLLSEAGSTMNEREDVEDADDAEDIEVEDVEVEKMDSFCQTESEELSTIPQSLTENFETNLCLTVERTVERILKRNRKSMSRNSDKMIVEVETESENGSPFTSSSNSPSFKILTDESITLTNGIHKNGIDPEFNGIESSTKDSTDMINNEKITLHENKLEEWSSSKGSKENTQELQAGEKSFEEMLQDFVDTEVL